MRYAASVAFVLVLTACGNESAPPAQSPGAAASAPPPAPSTPPPPTDEQIMASAAAQQRAMQDAADKANQKLQADVAAAAAEKRSQDVAKAKAQCAESRPTRAAEAQKQVREYAAFLKRVAPHLKYIKANCGLKDTTGTRVETERDGKGVIVRTRRLGAYDTLDCNGGPPKGVAEDDVKAAIYELRMPEETGKENVSQGDAMCAAFDAEVGLVTELTKRDGDGMKKLLEWKPTP